MGFSIPHEVERCKPPTSTDTCSRLDRPSAPPPGILMSAQRSLACQRLSTRLQWSFGSLFHFRSSESCYSSSEYSDDGRSSEWSCSSSVLELCRGLQIRYERPVSWWARR